MKLYELMAALEKSGLAVESMDGVARIYKASMSSNDFLSETKRAIDNKKYKAVSALITTAIYARDVNACCGALEYIISSCPQKMREVREWRPFDFIHSWFADDVYFKMNASGGAARVKTKPLTKKELTRLRRCYDFLHFGEYDNSVSESSMTHGLVKSMNNSDTLGTVEEVGEWVKRYIAPKMQKKFEGLECVPAGKIREQMCAEIYIKVLTSVAFDIFKGNAKTGLNFISMLREVEGLWNHKKFFLDILMQIKSGEDKVLWMKTYDQYVSEKTNDALKNEWIKIKHEVKVGNYGDAGWIHRYELVEQTKAMTSNAKCLLGAL